MQNVYEAHAEELKALQVEMGDNCPFLTYDGNDIPICAGGALFKTSNSPGGNSFMSDLQLTVLAKDFGEDFDFEAFDQQTFEFQGKTYRVDTTTTAPNGLQVRINANSHAQGL